MENPALAQDQLLAGRVVANGDSYRIMRLPSGVLELVLDGTVTDALFDEFFSTFHEVLEANAPARLVIDMGALAPLSMSTRWRLGERMKAQRHLIHRTGVYHTSDWAQVAGRILLRVTGRNNIALVKTRDEALEYVAG